MAVPDPLGEPGSPPENIGPTLRRAREAAGYSIGEVAERMRLSPNHIENLETERFDLFPVSVFLRGYLTSYARLVGIDEGPLLDAYDRRGFGPPQLHSPETARTAARGSEFTVTVTTLVVIGVLVILSALWWREQWSEGNGPPAPTVAQPGEENTPRGVGEDAGERAGAALPAAGSDPEDPPLRDGVAEPSDTGSPPVAAGGRPPPVPAGRRPPAAAGPAEAVPVSGADARTPAAESVPSNRGEGSEEPVEAVPGEGTRPPPATPGSGEGDAMQAGESGAGGEEGGLASLVIRVREDCWLMIRDADQRLIYRNLAAAGALLEFAAAPPIRIVAGYAVGIEIEYEGEPFDLSPYVEPNTGTARFRLGS